MIGIMVLGMYRFGREKGVRDMREWEAKAEDEEMEGAG
jgi:hypothetical protein